MEFNDIFGWEDGSKDTEIVPTHIISNERIEDLMSQYYSCNMSFGKPVEFFSNIKEELEEKKETNNPASESSSKQTNNPASESSSKQIRRKRLVDDIDFGEKLELIKSIVNALILTRPDEARNKCIINSKRKPKNTKNQGNSIRRSQYLGVSRNSQSFQVLIAIYKRKTYLGSFTSEKEAAITFDFYSILLHSLEAHTNFSYTAYAVNEMIKNFEANGKHFSAREFIVENDPEVIYIS